ncbi:protealysin inhibitor emfourin [Monashia sp. NPDC004114]
MSHSHPKATIRPRCTIVPPYMLEALARSGEPALAAKALEALAHDAALRQSRRTPTAMPTTRRPPRPVTGEQGAVAPSPRRTISDAQGSQSTPGRQVRAEGEPASSDVAVNEAYDGLGATWTLWETAYDRDSLDGKGLPLLATVHYGRSYDNAFWDGTQMVFGDGDGVVFQRFTRSLDVIGHELAHGVTEHTAGLLYQGQSGALNESISDVFGVLVKQRALGQSAADADWLIGAELLMPSVQGRALRDMLNPGTAYDDPQLGKDPQPASMADYVQTDDDNGGVHINSGIPNRAFALAARAIGGNAWDDAGHIWYAVLSGDGIKADCDFATFAGLTVAAAVAAFGSGSTQHHAVRDAWEQVGVLEPGSADGGSTGSAPIASTGDGSAGDGSAGDGWGDGSPDAPPSGPAHGEVPGVDAHLLLRRTGGFAGLVRERHVALGDLPERDAKDWQHLLAAPTLQRIAALEERAQPDAYCYSVVCEQVDLDVDVAEPHLPEAIHQLFERTLGQG